jgi:putative membrane protein
MMMSGMGAWMILWGLLGLVLLALAVIGLVYLVRSLLAQSAPGRPIDRESAQEILRRRYAAGESDEEEYLRRTSGLSQR